MATYKLRVTTSEGAASEEVLRLGSDEAALLHAFSLTAGRAVELRRGDYLLAKIDDRPRSLHLKSMLASSRKATCH